MLTIRQKIPTLTLTRREKVQISRLINSIFYFIDVVYILEKNGKFRLIALNNRRVLTDRSYPTFTGAKIAFSKLYRDKAWQKDVKAEWSHFYTPDHPWFDDKMKIAENAH